MAHDIHMDREKASESENFQTLFLQMGNQIPHDPGGHAAARVPKFSLNQEADIRKLRLGARPLAAPHNYCPYIYAAEVVS